MTDWKMMFELKQDDWIDVCREVDALKAELVNREGEKQEMREVIDRLKAEVENLTAERGHYKAGWAGCKAGRKREREANAKLREALEDIASTCEWYACTHKGPEIEVHHALKVEIPDQARQALLAAKQDEGKKVNSRCSCWPGCEASDEGNG